MAEDPETLASGCPKPFEAPGAPVAIIGPGNLLLNVWERGCERVVVSHVPGSRLALSSGCGQCQQIVVGKRGISGSQRVLVPAVRGGGEGEVASGPSGF